MPKELPPFAFQGEVEVRGFFRLQVRVPHYVYHDWARTVPHIHVEFGHGRRFITFTVVSFETEIAAYQKKIAEYTKGIRELYLDKVKGILSELDYLDLSKDFSTQKERLEKLVIDTQKQLDVIERKMLIGDNRRQLIEQYTNLEHLDRETVEKLIDYVLVGKKDPVTKEVPIEIHWNF